MTQKVLRLKINGEEVELLCPPHFTLLELLRERAGLTATHHGCELGECGMCVVLEEGRPILSCLRLAHLTAGRAITTLEGVATAEGLHPLQQTFAEFGATQCGYCTPAMILTARAFLERFPNPSRQEIQLALSGVLCRCTGYNQIIEAIVEGARRMRGEPPCPPPPTEIRECHPEERHGG